MKRKTNLHQEAAEKAKAKIIKAAQALFIERGFSGASMSAIAKAARINQSLVYHYFESKEDLWRQVKGKIISSVLEEANLYEAPQVETLDELLDHLVIHRYKLHAQNRDLVRMLMWQALEKNGTAISGTSEVWMDSWLKTIARLQKNKVVTKRYNPYEIMIWFNGIIWAPFVTGSPHPKFAKNIDSFLKKMVKELRDRLKPEDKMQSHHDAKRENTLKR